MGDGVKILVTGGEGLLGSELARLDGVRTTEARPRIVAPGRRELDVTDAEQTHTVVGREAPEWIVHCAAYTDVDGAEREPHEAMAANAANTRMWPTRRTARGVQEEPNTKPTR